MFFELLIKYQQIKTELKVNLERYKVELRLYYAEQMNKINGYTTK